MSVPQKDQVQRRHRWPSSPKKVFLIVMFHILEGGLPEKLSSNYVCTSYGLTSKSREGLLSLESDRRPEDRLRDRRRPFLISLTWAYKGTVDSDDVFVSSMDFFIREASITKHQFTLEKSCLT